MKIVFFSDTHTKHEDLKHIPDGDVICFTGDLMSSGYDVTQIFNFLDWFEKLPHGSKIFIAGNHDRFIQNKPTEFNKILENYPSIIYLQDSEVVIEGVKFYGSPWQPWFWDWAFNVKTSEELKNIWKNIPDDTDILLTHGPAYGFLDHTIGGKRVGCHQLLNRIKEIKPKIHCCGHIHEGYGLDYLKIDDHMVRLINASVLNERYQLTNKPIVVDL
jgi:Icc-related predicted phosphoesterase